MSESERETRPLLRIVGPSVCFCKWMGCCKAEAHASVTVPCTRVYIDDSWFLRQHGSTLCVCARLLPTSAEPSNCRLRSTSTSDRLEARQGNPVLPPLCNSTSGQPLFCALFVVGPECDLLSSPDRADHAVMAASRSLPQLSVYDNELLPEYHLLRKVKYKYSKTAAVHYHERNVSGFGMVGLPGGAHLAASATPFSVQEALVCSTLEGSAWQCR